MARGLILESMQVIIARPLAARPVKWSSVNSDSKLTLPLKTSLNLSAGKPLVTMAILPQDYSKVGVPNTAVTGLLKGLPEPSRLPILVGTSTEAPVPVAA